MRLVVLIVGVLLMGITAFFGLWVLALVAAILTALALVWFFEFYRSIPFLLILLGTLSFFLAGSAWSQQSRFHILRGILFGLISLGISLISAMACAEILVVQQGGTRRAAHNMMIGLLVAPLFPTTNPLGGLFARFARSFRALQIVQDGTVVHSMPPSEDFRVLGPGALIIRSGNAAVLEKSGKITRIVGPGFYLTEPFEHLSAIVDLSLQCEQLSEEDVLTKDSISLKVEGTVQYRIMIDQPALIAKAEYRLDQDAIRRAVLTTADWKKQTEIVAKSVLRDTIATRFLDEIYDPRSLHYASGATPRVPLQDEMRRRLSRESQRWGVEIVRVTLDKIILPEKVQGRMVEAWDTTWHDVVQMARALTEAKEIAAKAIGAGQAERVKATQAARARLEAAGIDRFVKLLEASGDGMAQLETARVSRQIAEFEAQRRVTQARAEADAQMIAGHAKAVAEADRFREVLLSLQQNFPVDEKTLCAVVIQLAGVLTDATDLHAFVRFVTGSRPFLTDTEPAHIIGGDEAPSAH